MNPMIQRLLERRDALATELDGLYDVELGVEADESAGVEAVEGRDLTDEEQVRKDELLGEVRGLDDRITELDEREVRNARVAEARARAGTAEVQSDISVGDEPKVYGEGSEHSFVADLVHASIPQFGGQYHSANERMSKYEYQVSVEIARNTDEGKRAVGVLRDAKRSEDRRPSDELISVLRERGNAGSLNGEQRTGMTTGTASGGSFVTPVYYIQEWAAFRRPGRAFIDACNAQPMPDYGLTIYIPHVTSGTNVQQQAGSSGAAPPSGTNIGTNEGSPTNESDPAASYLSVGLATIYGQVVISQQLLDRAGPNFAFDRLVFDQLTRDYNAAADQFVLTQALIGAGTIAYNASAFQLTAQGAADSTTPGAYNESFYSKIGFAKATIRTTNGTIMDPTHLFVDPRRWEFLAATQFDTQGRPLVVPNYANPYNAAGAGNTTGVVGYEGDTGYTLNALPVFHDLNIPTPSSGADQAIVGALDEVYVWESNLVPRVVPQTYAQNLQVLLQVYAYLGTIPRYPSAIQTITGSAMTTPW